VKNVRVNVKRDRKTGAMRGSATSSWLVSPPRERARNCATASPRVWKNWRPGMFRKASTIRGGVAEPRRQSRCIEKLSYRPRIVHDGARTLFDPVNPIPNRAPAKARARCASTRHPRCRPSRTASRDRARKSPYRFNLFNSRGAQPGRPHRRTTANIGNIPARPPIRWGVSVRPRPHAACRPAQPPCSLRPIIIDCSAPICGTISPVRSVIASQFAATPSTDRSSPVSNLPGVSVT